MSAILPSEAYAVEYATCLEAFIPPDRAREYATHAASIATVYMVARRRPNYGNAHTPMSADPAAVLAKVRQAACEATETPECDFDYCGGNKQRGGKARTWYRTALLAAIGAGNAGKLLGEHPASVTTSARRFRSMQPRMAAEAEAFGTSIRDPKHGNLVYDQDVVRVLNRARVAPPKRKAGR